MKPSNSVVCMCLVAAFTAVPVAAQSTADSQIEPGARIDTVALADLLDAVRDTSGRTFLVDHRVNQSVVTAQLDTEDLDYSDFLHILRNNGLAAVNSKDIVTIVPIGIVRQLPLPVIEEEDDAMNDEEWVTWMVFVDKALASELVPILRPMMPPEGHLAANPPSNGIVIVDRYGNAKRIVALIREMDGATRRQP
jgi:general secretion pathway protein D